MTPAKVIHVTPDPSVTWVHAPLTPDPIVTWVHALVAALHDGAVDAGDQPGADHTAGQQTQDTVAQPHHHVVEEEEVEIGRASCRERV